jgi:uncharacterized repeat protein (TIGR03803 family)
MQFYRCKAWGCWMRSRAAHCLALLGVVAFMPLAKAQTFTVLHSFADATDGSEPQVGLYQNAFYGTTFLGGHGLCNCGTVFKISSSGFRVLHVFAGSDGANPAPGLAMDASGNLYGTTSQGGSNGYGTVFKLAPATAQGGNWTETVLYAFAGGTDGAHPYGGVILDAAGNIYGTTTRGGAFGHGAVFKLAAGGTETVVYSFSGLPDGAYSYARLAFDAAGNIYGTTMEGGTFNQGTVFELNPSGTEIVLHSFAGGTDGAYPNAGVILDASDNIYGTTDQGGDSSSDGTVFKLSVGGTYSVLYTFKGGKDGSGPAAGLVLDPAGNLYGTTTEGGDSDYDGMVFKISPGGKETQLYVFTGRLGGSYGYTGVVRDTAGNLYGTSTSAGQYGNGLAFKLTP